MLKIILVATVCLGISAAGTSKMVTNHETGKTSDQVPAGYFKENKIPKVEEGCVMKFECKKKLKNAESPKPCVKYCAKRMECTDGRKITIPAGHCVDLDETMVAQEYNDCRNDGDAGKDSIGIMSVALIDFPCQPGYLPDSRGRCREVW